MSIPTFRHVLLDVYCELVRPRYCIWYGCIFALTYFIIVGGFDWQYNIFVHKHINAHVDILSVADGLGFIVGALAVIIPCLLYLVTKKDVYMSVCAAAILVLVVALSVSIGVKAFAGRESPPHFHSAEGLPKMETWEDNSGRFQFGFLREQIFGGYPSSHAAVFFGFASSYYFHIRMKKRRATTCEILCCGALFSFAFFVSIGVSFGHHWLTESLAGALFGCAIGHALSRHIRSES